uniref:Precorrin-6Y C5,15-methyltransferase (Decarboxylating) n=1 Tax=Candidatus Kentrum sp. TUN TaxID=2126343 RepID=A0A450ZIV4_9GAMM|nr:MAG: precorrin-6Y C5,15-methyltransferase (decarboxylating) [Candidatus Kentron sp. TUN]VFK55288.1 MAG: precorrin-6Y C5,15-methyltransferase (decarboxylating) [Candidatus Kentron sp. TUN]
MTEPCHVIGLLDDGAAGLAPSMLAVLAAADLVIGTGRTLALLAPSLSAQAQRRDLTSSLMQVPEWIESARQAGQRVVVLATGDPLCHGIGRFLVNRLGSVALAFHPAPSTLQIACARLGLAWQGMRILSVHREHIDDWQPDAGPEHGFAPLLRACQDESLVGLFTSPENGPERVARSLMMAGLGEAYRMIVAERLLLPEERLSGPMPVSEAANRTFAVPNVVILQRTVPPADSPLFGLPDEWYLQRRLERGLISAREVRAVALAHLALGRQEILWDIGAGSGAVGLEAARLCRHVMAVEKNAEDAAIVRRNRARMAVVNHTLLEAKAPEGLAQWSDPDAVFIGGSGGNLAELIERCLSRLNAGGRLVATFVTLENLATALASLEQWGGDWEVNQIQATRSKPLLGLHRMRAENPVWIVCARKERI